MTLKRKKTTKQKNLINITIKKFNNMQQIKGFYILYFSALIYV